MAQHITAEDIFHLALIIIETDDDFTRFSQTLLSWNDHFQDFVSAFRAIHYVKARLHMLQPSDDKQLHRVQTLIRYIDTELELLIDHRKTFANHTSEKFHWTGSIVELVEVIYALDELGCINNGQTDIKELAAFFSSQLGVKINARNCYDAYLFRHKTPQERQPHLFSRQNARTA